MGTNRADEKRQLEVQRCALTRQLGRTLEIPMMVLGLAWLGLLVLDFTRGLPRAGEIASDVIWVTFIIEFLLRFLIAPNKISLLRRNWLTVISLVVPAFRIFRIFQAVRLLRAARVVRGLRLLRVVGSLNRGMRALSASMGRRGFGYVCILTCVVTFVDAAGMLAFENPASGGGLQDYGSALWWTAMIMTTMGSEYWPRTLEGRVLCFLLSLYALGVLGYVAGILATFFVGRDAANAKGEIVGERAVEALRSEVAALRADLREQRRSGTAP